MKVYLFQHLDTKEYLTDPNDEEQLYVFTDKHHAEMVALWYDILEDNYEIVEREI